jgi:hypothetical protein
MCRLLAVSRSGFYAWRHRQPSAREMADAELLIEIKEIFAASGQTYGSPRIHIELREQGIRCGRKHVERLMGENGLKVPRKRYSVRLTDYLDSDTINRCYFPTIPFYCVGAEIWRRGWLSDCCVGVGTAVRRSAASSFDEAVALSCSL